MAFRSISSAHLTKFNSAVSSDLIELYESNVEEEVLERSNRPKSRSIAPSSIRCLRKTWFRLRGVQPDKPKSADCQLDFTARIGDACHELLQSRLSTYLGDDWISVEDYFKEFPPSHKYELDLHGYETRVEFLDIPIKFSVDGIIRMNEEYYLLEIKSSEYSSFNDLADPKPQHTDQVKCYATLLNIHKALILYIDRQYGGIKCFELVIKDSDMESMNASFDEVLQMAEAGLAPDALPSGDSWCSAAMCDYYEKCKEYGRY